MRTTLFCGTMFLALGGLSGTVFADGPVLPPTELPYAANNVEGSWPMHTPVTTYPQFPDFTWNQGNWCVEDGFYLGLGFMAVAPYIGNNKSFPSAANTDYANPCQVAEQAWLGYSWSNGLGIRFHFFNFDESSTANGTNPLNALTYDAINANRAIYLTALDLEFTKVVDLAGICLTFGAGLRYVHMLDNTTRNDVVTLTASSTPIGLVAVSTNGDFDGIGPTVSFEARYPIRPWLEVYGSLRGSYLFGSQSQDSTATAIGFASTTAKPVDYSRCISIPVGEAEVGLQWEGGLGRMRPFMRTGITAQTWSNLLINNFNANTSGSNSSLGLFGFSFMAGLQF